MALSGVAVAIATTGGVLVLSAVRNIQPADMLRSILKRPNQSRPISAALGDVASGLGSYQPTATTTGTAGAGAGGGLVDAVRSKLGAPYVWASSGPDTFDCSGLVYWGLKNSGWSPPRFVTGTFGLWASRNGWTRVGREQLQAGDVVLKVGHMGVMVSPDRMINAPHAGAVVREAPLWAPQSQWWGWRPGAPASGGGGTSRAVAD